MKIDEMTMKISEVAISNDGMTIIIDELALNIDEMTVKSMK